MSCGVVPVGQFNMVPTISLAPLKGLTKCFTEYLAGIELAANALVMAVSSIVLIFCSALSSSPIDA